MMKNADSKKAVITATMLSITIFAFLDFGFFSFLPISKNLPYASTFTCNYIIYKCSYSAPYFCRIFVRV